MAIAAAVATAAVTTCVMAAPTAAGVSPTVRGSPPVSCFGRAAVACTAGDTCVLGRATLPPGTPPRLGPGGVHLPPPTIGVCTPLPADILAALRPCVETGVCPSVAATTAAADVATAAAAAQTAPRIDRTLYCTNEDEAVTTCSAAAAWAVELAAADAEMQRTTPRAVMDPARPHTIVLDLSL
ncbi:hypothetical protein MMPV_007781 [Pyropia vietnamensis]